MNYSSIVDYVSSTWPEVTVQLRRVSFARRNELTKMLAPMAARMKALAASTSDADVAAAGILRREMASALLEWGIVEVSGLTIDGISATKQLLIECGPEELTLEILSELHHQISLTEEERKN